MFLNIDKHDQKKTAIKDDIGNSLTFSEVCQVVKSFESLNLPRCVVFCLCENCAASLLGYIAFENNKQVPLLLSAGLDQELRKNLDSTYQPSYYWLPTEKVKEIEGDSVFSCFGYSITTFPTLLIYTSSSSKRYSFGSLTACDPPLVNTFAVTIISPPEKSIYLCIYFCQ